MKNIGRALLATIVIFFLSLLVVAPTLSKMGYSSVEGSYHAATHALLLSCIFTVLVCTMVILEELKGIKEDSKDKNN